MVIATQIDRLRARSKHPAATLRELIAQAKAKPGTLNYGSSGPGSSLHLFAEMFKSAAGVDLVHIPYRGDAPMITAMMAGDVQLGIPAAGDRPSSQSRATRSRRWRSPDASGWPQLPDVPTVTGTGVTGFEERQLERPCSCRPATPPDIVLAIQQAMAKVLADPQVSRAPARVGRAGRRHAGTIARSVQGRHRAFAESSRRPNPEAGLTDAQPDWIRAAHIVAHGIASPPSPRRHRSPQGCPAVAGQADSFGGRHGSNSRSANRCGGARTLAC